MIEFLPGGAHQLLHLSMHELLNALLPLEAINRQLAYHISHAFDMHMASPAWYPEKILEEMDRLFARCLTQTEDARLSRHVILQLYSANGNRRVADIARYAGRSPRQLARVLADTIGMPAKLLARIIRTNAACRHMSTPNITLTELAHRLDYHDQAHFIHDFTAICGVTPGDYLRRMSLFYNETLKLGGTIF